MQIWLILFEVRGDSEPMPVKPGGHFDHAEPARVASERALAPFVRDEVMLPRKMRHEQCKCPVERVGNGQVDHCVHQSSWWARTRSE
jgi:hypothetical protein